MYHKATSTVYNVEGRENLQYNPYTFLSQCSQITIFALLCFCSPLPTFAHLCSLLMHSDHNWMVTKWVYGCGRLWSSEVYGERAYFCRLFTLGNILGCTVHCIVITFVKCVVLSWWKVGFNVAFYCMRRKGYAHIYWVERQNDFKKNKKK